MKPKIIVSIAMAIFFTTACNPSPIPPITPVTTPGSPAITTENAATLIELAEFSQGEMGIVAALTFTPNRTELRAVHARTPVLRHWSIHDHKLLAEYELESVGLGAVAFDETASLLVMTGADHEAIFSDDYLRNTAQPFGPNDSIYFIDAESGQVIGQLRRPGNAGENYYGLALNRDGGIVATKRTEDLGRGIILDQKPELLIFEVPKDRSAPASPVFSTVYADGDFVLDVEGRLLAIHTDHDGVIQLWDMESQQEWGELKPSTDRSNSETSYYATQLAIAPTRQWLAVFSLLLVDNDKLPQVTLWRLDERQVQWQTEIEARFITTLTFNPSGTLLAAGASDGVHVWNVETGEEVKFFPGKSTFAVTFSPDGSKLAWGDWAGIIHLAGLPEN